jgi:hypothetical protein
MTKENSAKGVHSFDANIGGHLVYFINRNTSTYPTEIGSGPFDLVPVIDQKDLMINAAKLNAKQEYDRIMELVQVLQKQAANIVDRLQLTEMVRNAEYNFRLYPGKIYWLVFDTRTQKYRLSILGPNDWSTGSPHNYEYLKQIQWLGDNTWQEIKT